MRHVSGLAILVALVIVAAGCGKKHVKQSAANVPVPQLTQFAPSADSSLTPDQIRGWTKANKALDSLSLVYKDSFSVSNPADQAKYEKPFRAAQDGVCHAQGLAGGYKEYAWVSQALANPRNKALCDSFGVAVYRQP